MKWTYLRIKHFSEPLKGLFSAKITFSWNIQIHYLPAAGVKHLFSCTWRWACGSRRWSDGTVRPNLLCQLPVPQLRPGLVQELGLEQRNVDPHNPVHRYPFISLYQIQESKPREWQSRRWKIVVKLGFGICFTVCTIQSWWGDMSEFEGSEMFKAPS